MRIKLRYFICAVLTLTLTATVVFMPYIYYSFSVDDDYLPQTEEFTLTGSGDYEPDFKEIYQLVHDDSAIWIDDDNYNEKLLLQKLSMEISELYWFFNGNSHTLSVYNAIKNLPLDTPYSTNSVIVSGTVDDKSVSVPFVFVEYINDDLEDGLEPKIKFSVLMNRNNGKIYQLSITGTDPFVDFYDSDNIDIEMYVTEQIGKYLSIDLHGIIQVSIYGTFFEYEAFSQSFYDLRYRISEIVY